MDEALAKALFFEDDHPEYDNWEYVDEEETYYKHDCCNVYRMFKKVGEDVWVSVYGLSSYRDGAEYEGFSFVRPKEVTKVVWMQVNG